MSEESQAITLISAQGLLGPEAPGYQEVRGDKTSINLIKLTWAQLISIAKEITTGQMGLTFQGVLFQFLTIPLRNPEHSEPRDPGMVGV